MYQLIPIALIAIGTALLARGERGDNDDDDSNSQRRSGGRAGNRAGKSDAAGRVHRTGGVSHAGMERENVVDGPGRVPGHNRGGEQDPAASGGPTLSVTETSDDDDQTSGHDRGPDHADHVRAQSGSGQVGDSPARDTGAAVDGGGVSGDGKTKSRRKAQSQKGAGRKAEETPSPEGETVSDDDNEQV